MELTILFFAVIQGMGISLGVGSSTLAILNFFHAIKDGTITETERNFMGITYHTLRLGMVMILISSIMLAIIGYYNDGAAYFTHYVIAQSILIFMLYINALCMTLHLIPSTFGPAIQASTWYTLGFIYILAGQGVIVNNLLVFILAYIAFIFFAITLINGVMAYLKDKLIKSKAQEEQAS